MDLTMTKCPECGSADFRIHDRYQTEHHGVRKIYECGVCLCRFSETEKTFMEGIRKPVSLICEVIDARTDGMGLNAAARVFNISKNTILSRERKFAPLHETLFLYSLTHEFLKPVIEGDELYTKVNRNVPPDQSAGWTIVLTDRASRFIWELRCGRKDRRLFENVVRTLGELADRTDDISIFTDGERRYGNILSEICSEAVRNGKRGRPGKTLGKGVRAGIKNKGSQAHKRGPNRPKYQSPWPEHPDTDQQTDDKDIHANHVGSFNSSLRRKCSAFRRKTNTYPKSSGGLQRILNVYRVIHNFVRVHLTTGQIPAVAVGIINSGLSLDEIFKVNFA